MRPGTAHISAARDPAIVLSIKESAFFGNAISSPSLRSRYTDLEFLYTLPQLDNRFLTSNLSQPPIDPHLSSSHRSAALTMASHPGLFSSDLISPTIAASLPETYTIRALRKDDYAKGFLDCLRVLTTVGDITEEQFGERYDFMNTQGKGAYYLLVIEDGKRVVGTGALIVEKKLCAPADLASHIP